MQKLPADLSQFNTSVVTSKQLCADLILDILYAPADRRLLDTKILCRAPEAAAVRSGREILEVTQVNF